MVILLDGISSGSMRGAGPMGLKATMKFSSSSPTPSAVMTSRHARRVAQRLVGQPLDDHRQQRRAEHRRHQGQREHDTGRQSGKMANQRRRGEEGHVGAHHEDVAVGEVDHGQDAVDHGIAEGDQRIDAADLQRVQDC